MEARQIGSSSHSELGENMFASHVTETTHHHLVTYHTPINPRKSRLVIFLVVPVGGWWFSTIGNHRIFEASPWKTGPQIHPLSQLQNWSRMPRRQLGFLQHRQMPGSLLQVVHVQPGRTRWEITTAINPPLIFQGKHCDSNWTIITIHPVRSVRLDKLIPKMMGK